MALIQLAMMSQKSDDCQYTTYTNKMITSVQVSSNIITPKVHRVPFWDQYIYVRPKFQEEVKKFAPERRTLC
eukprot:CFRG6009T1